MWEQEIRKGSKSQKAGERGSVGGADRVGAKGFH